MNENETPGDEEIPDAEAYLKGKSRKRSFLREVGTLARMARAMAKREYPMAPATMALIGGTLFYVVSPVDAVPDVLPVVGFADDAGVVAITLSMAASEIAAFRDWEIQQESAA